MLKLELKRIFSKKINVFAIGLALILAVIFSGFAVTSNRYVDENGNASTGIMATRKLTDNRRAWKGTLTASKGGQLARRKSLNYALIFPENILLTLFFISMNTIFTSFRICENSYK
jgi:nicotinate-nucleotide pyrophosphorylase